MPSNVEFLGIASSQGQEAATRALYRWLCNDNDKATLYADLMERASGVLEFQSRAADDDENPKTYSKKVLLVVDPQMIDAMFSASSSEGAAPLYSNDPFAALGGTFMLSMDNPTSHDAQRAYAKRHLETLTVSKPVQAGQQPYCDADLLTTAAFKMGSVLSFKQFDFDLTYLAEQVALQAVALAFGFSQTDLLMLETTTRKIGRGVQYQVMGRHFTTEPLLIRETKTALATLVKRAAEIIDLFQTDLTQIRPEQKEERDKRLQLDEELNKLRGFWFENPEYRATKAQLLGGYKPIMQLMAEEAPSVIFTTAEKAVIVAGLVAGTVANIQASVTTVIKEFLDTNHGDLQAVWEEVAEIRLAHRDAHFNGKMQDFEKRIKDVLTRHPPVAFLPRRVTESFKLRTTNFQIPQNTEILMGLGATANAPTGCPFAAIFGGDPNAQNKGTSRDLYTHSCIGMALAMKVVCYTVLNVMSLPGLSQVLDTQTGKPLGLTKSWGYNTGPYPLQFHREKILRQNTLQTILEIKKPISVHADGLRHVVRYGAPVIEKILKDARHIHFASFLLIDNDNKIALFTVFNGDFDPYIAHFAREFGPVLDRFFEHIQEAPMMPIREHPVEFAQYLRRFNQRPAEGYFFSAYPEAQAANIRMQFTPRNFDYNELGLI
jgi:cytochrome P450